MDKDFNIERLKWLTAFQEQMRISNVSREVPNLARDLKNFSLKQTVSLVAALLVSPGLHANTVRVESLQHLACLNCNGQRVPTCGELAEWLNRYLGSTVLAAAEDPPEDVFISNVITPRGNNRIFEGIWEVNDFYLQQVVDVAMSFPVAHPLQESVKNILNFLALSEAIASRLNFSRFIEGAGDPKVDVRLPAWDDISARARAVTFTATDLKRLNIEEADLTPFVMPLSAFPELHSATVGHSKLERFPLLRFGGDLIVALPTAIGAAARAFLLEEVSRCGEAEHFMVHLRGLQGDLAFNDAVRDLEAEILFDEKLPPKPEGIPMVDDVVCKFDEGKFAHVVLIQDNTLSRLEEGFTTFKSLSNDGDRQLRDYLETVAKRYASSNEYAGGITVVVFGGLGGAVTLGLGAFPDHWQNAAFSLADFALLGQLERISLLRLWKFKREIARAESLGVHFLNSNGDINMLALWCSQKYSLIPNGLPLGEPAQWLIRTNHILDLRQTLRRTFDRHAIYCLSPHAWLPVQRESPRTMFRQAENLPVFVCPEALRAKRLVGVVETEKRPWWLVSDQEFPSRHQRALQKGLWHGLLFWLHKLAQTMDARRQLDLPDGQPVHIFLCFEGIPLIDAKEWDHSKAEQQHLRAEVDPNNNSVIVYVPLDYFAMFALPENSAEFNLVAALAHAVSQLSSKPLDQSEAVAIARAVMRSPDARLIHVTSAQTFREQARLIHEHKPRFLFEEDLSTAQIGLGRDVNSRPTSSREIRGIEACNDFLHDVTVKVWGRLSKMLSSIDRESVAIRALENIEGIAAEQNNSRLTARALISLYTDEEDVIKGSGERDSDRAGASLASRILVEMAICTCPLTGGRAISGSDFDTLLANVAQLIHVGNQSDAMVNKLVEPALIQIRRNSTYWMNEGFRAEVVDPYLSGNFRHGFMAAAADYESHFESHEPDPLYLERTLPREFQVAVISEFGISAQKLLDADLEMGNFALRSKKAILVIKRSELCELLKRTPGLADDEIEAVFANFSLFPRQLWNEMSPAGFHRKDWYPWAFRRQLSLLRRPLLVLENVANPRILLSPGLFFASLSYILEGALEGNFPREYFTSGSMRTWIDTVGNKNGQNFEKFVAEEFRKLGLRAESSIKLTAFKGPQMLGDVDVLVWDERRRRLLVIECKRLQPARTVGEIAEQLNRFQRDVTGYFAKHLARLEYLRNHLNEVSRFLRVNVNGCFVDAVIVTNTIVPLQFMVGLPIRKERIVSINELADLLE